MNLTNMRDALRLELGDPGGITPTWSDDELTRCIYHAVDDLSRFTPLDRVLDKVVALDITAESFTTGPTLDLWITLAHHPISADTGVTVTNSGATVTYTENTDYEMDYANGKIKVLSTGSMAISTTYKITYTIFQITVDISSIDPTRIYKVEYPAGQIPLEFCPFWVHNDILYVQYMPSDEEKRQSMQALSGGDHVIIYYAEPHDYPSDSANGSYPPYFDAVVILGANSYALHTKANKYRLAAATALEGIAAINTLSDAVHTAITTAHNSSVTAIAVVVTALEKAQAYLDAIEATGDNLLTDAKTAQDAVQTLLTSGEALINQLNKGVNVASAYGDYATAQINRANTIEGLIDRYISMVDRCLEKATGYMQKATNYMEQADDQGSRLVDYANRVANEINKANSYQTLADRFYTNYIRLYDQFMSILKDKAQTREQMSISAQKQPY